MENILKRRIVFFSLLLLACVFSVGIFMQSCSNSEDDDIFRDAPPKLKSLMTSSEYVSLNEHIKSLGKELKTNYKKLSESEKEEVINILNTMKDNSDSQEDNDKLFEEFHAIMKFDFKTAIEKISEDAMNLRLYNNQNNISSQEYIFAVNKYTKSGVPRLKDLSEDTLQCVIECVGTTLICLELCTLSGPGMILCDASCLFIMGVCCILCE